MGPRQAVTAPVNTPPLVSLVRSARRVDEGDFRWENGFAFSPEGCEGGGILDPCGTTEKTISDNPALVEYDPYVVYAGDKCSSFGWQDRDYQARARRFLEACQSKHIAAELWTGTLATSASFPNPFFTDIAGDVVATAVTPTEALACLEQGLAECQCGAGMIHATPNVVTHWINAGLVLREGGLLMTYLGTIVVADGGYPGTGPGGTEPASGAVWAYATGIVEVRLGEVQIFPATLKEALNRETNLIEFRAERMASAVWDNCCLLAASVDVELCIIGGS